MAEVVAGMLALLVALVCAAIAASSTGLRFGQVGAGASSGQDVLDAQGRLQDEIDPNGVLTHTTRDGLGRPVATWKHETTELVHTDPLVSGYATATAFEVMDGFGAVVQSWQPDETDSAWVVTESERDVGGHLVSTTKPHRETVFDSSYSEKGAPLVRNWVDALGEIRYSFEDEEAGSGETISYVTAPGVRDVTDASGWAKRTTTDIHGRTVSVEAGYSALALELEGGYLWDGRGRLTRFTDGNGGEWRYHQDGAGRLRSTTRVASAGAETPYLTVDYLGAMPIRQWDQTGTAPKEVARFTWDLAGRETQHQLFDDLTGTWQTWTTTWDTLWKGAKTSEVDPAGTMTWEYAAGPFGKFGQPTRARRTFTGFAATPVFEWRYDFAGREVSKTWPSGEVVATTWSASGKRLTSSVAAGPTVTYTFDQWGYPSGFETGGVVQSTVPQTIPHLEPFTHEYDAHQRITELRQDVNNIQETYSYDAIGNLASSWQKVVGGDPWVYDPATRFSEMPHRSQMNAGVEVHDVQVWDSQGRLSTWTNTRAGVLTESRSYVYDGAGHLRRQSVLPAGGGALSTTTFQYDNSDLAVVEKTVRGAAVTNTLRFLDWEQNVTSGEVREPLMPMYRRQGTTYRWVMLEPDGHAILVLKRTGEWLRTEMQGVQGNALGQYTSGAAWPMDGQHGDRPNLSTGLNGRGARSTLLRDGTWLQPEPFLRYGPTKIAGMAPHLTQGVYASGNTNSYADSNGYTPIALAPVAEVGIPVVLVVLAVDYGLNGGRWTTSLLNGAGAGVGAILTPPQALVDAVDYLMNSGEVSDPAEGAADDASGGLGNAVEVKLTGGRWIGEAGANLGVKLTCAGCYDDLRAINLSKECPDSPALRSARGRGTT